MDPMDYTMNDGQQLQQPNIPGCNQYNQPQQSQPSPNFSSRPQNAHHYDPVHNTDTWFSQSRPQFGAPQNLHQYPGTHAPLASWQAYGQARSGMYGDGHNYAESQTQRPHGFPGIANGNSWGEFRGYESFGYPAQMHAQAHPQDERIPSMGGLSSSRGTMASATVTGPILSRPWTGAPTIQNHSEASRRNRLSTTLQSTPTGPDISLHETIRVSRAAREERLAQQSQISRSYDYAQSRNTPHPPHTRRRFEGGASRLDSDDEDDATQERIFAHMRYRDAVYQYSAAADDDRTILALRAAGLGKKIPSKEAIASIEKLDMKDLASDEKSCIICYNEFGVSNPEGVIEQPIRLPKCKHIFGDKCIQKWFEDKDTCPYCRDKLPSEKLARTYHYAFEALTTRHRDRMAAAAAVANPAAPSGRRHAISGRSSTADDFDQANRAHPRQAQDEYNYLMNAHQQSEPWSLSPPGYRPGQRDATASERRRLVMREQARLRVLSGRPTSVGSSTRFTNPNTSYPNPNQRGVTIGRHMANAPNLSNYRPSTPPGPGLSRQSSDGSFDSNQGSSSSQEASPAVVVGSGVVTGERSAPATYARSSAFTDHFWLDRIDTPSTQAQTLALTQSQSQSQAQPGRHNFFRSSRPSDFGRASSFESRNTLPAPVNQRSGAEVSSLRFGNLNAPQSSAGIFGDLTDLS